MGSIEEQKLEIRHKNDFGPTMYKQFPFAPDWRNLNHGSFGSFPKVIQAKFRDYQDQCEACPDTFIRYTYPKLLDESREAIAKVVNAPVETVVFVSNATVGVNTVFRNLSWNEDGKDVIITFSTIYEACGKVADYLVDYTNGRVGSREIELTYPIDDDEIIAKFRDTVKQIEAGGQRARIAIFDVVSSRPGVVFPWEELVKVCRDLGVLSMVDGAQGVGMVRLDLGATDPDFFVSNCHKWLHVPRGCAVFFCPARNQHLLPTTLATSHGYVPKLTARTTPLPPSRKSAYVANFEFVGTLDNAPYLCVKDAVRWREQTFGGEDKVLEYLWDLNKRGSDLVGAALDTPVMENRTGTLRNCGMANVALPIWTGTAAGEGAKKETDVVLSAEDAGKAFQWILQRMIEDYKTFMSLFVHGGRFWVRISAQVYLGLEDYEWAAKVLIELCERVGKKEYLEE